MTVVYQVDSTGALSALSALQQRQLPFALASAMNRTAEEFQDAMQQGVRERFTIRVPRVDRVAKIERGNCATKELLRVIVDVDPRFGFWRKFEQGGTKTELNPTMPIAIPATTIRPAFADTVPRSLYPKNLRLVERRDISGTLPPKAHVTRRGVLQIKGKQRTFVLDPASMFGVQTWGVYQRTGPGKHDIRLLWRYKHRVPIPAKLQWQATAERVVATRWAINFEGMLAYALRTAR